MEGSPERKQKTTQEYMDLYHQLQREDEKKGFNSSFDHGEEEDGIDSPSRKKKIESTDSFDDDDM